MAQDPGKDQRETPQESEQEKARREQRSRAVRSAARNRRSI